MKKPTARTGNCLVVLLFFLPVIIGCQKEVEPIPDSFSLRVVSTSPQESTVGFAYDGEVTATLNDFADTTRFLITLSVSTGDALIKGWVKIQDSLVSFSPEAELSTTTAYTAWVTISEKKSGAKAYEYKWSFTTKEPDGYRMTLRSNRVTDFVRDGSRCMQLGDHLYSFGGWTDNPPQGQMTYSDVYRSSGDLSVWERMPDAPWPSRHVFGCVKKDEKVWVLGGDNLNTDWDIWNSEDGLTWTKIGATNPEIVGQRIFAGYCTHSIGKKEWLYIIGGYGHKDVLRSLDGIKWEIVSSNVSALASATEPNGEGFSGSAVSLNGNLYLVCGGGGTSWGPPRKSVFKSTDHGMTWQQLPDFPGAPRRYTDVIVFDKKLWAIGGYDDTGVGNLSDVWYMTENGTWHQVPTPGEYIGRHATGLAVYNNQLVITCGNYHNDCWVIEKVK